MSPRRALVLYASTHGHTERIAQRIETTLRSAGAEVSMHAVQDAGAVDPVAFDIVIAGASVHVGHHQAAMTEWLTRNHGGLVDRPTALFSVSLTAADASPEAARAVDGYLADLIAEAGLQPGLASSFAGALQYREYGVATRVLVRLIARSKHLPTDPAVDVDYTDWEAVERFAHEALALAPEAVPA